MTRKYTLEDVQEAAKAIETFITINTGISDKTDPLLKELAPLNYAPANLDEADSILVTLRTIVGENRVAVYNDLKTLGNARWPGTYVLHDLICALAHFGFVTRYARKDTTDGNPG